MAHRLFFQKSLILLLFFCFFPWQVIHAESSLLSQEENLWLASRNNTIVVIPEKNHPPFSYQSHSGIIQGFSVEYLELVARSIDVNIHYATPRSRNQIISELKEGGRGDIALSIGSTDEREESLIFTESYVTVPVVIVVRKDAELRKNITMNDYTGRRVAVVDSSASEEFIRQNYPRVVLETVTDNEVGLQQVVLGEVDAAVMDVASLSFLLSKQVLSSVKIAGNLGLDYKPTFAMSKDKIVLQSILEKGISQISNQDRELLTEKWIVLPGEKKEQQSFFMKLQAHAGIASIYTLFGIILLLVAGSLFRGKSVSFPYVRKTKKIDSLKEEITELEEVSKVLSKELEQVKEMEEHIAEKIEHLKD